MPGSATLRYSRDCERGIRRVRRGRGFEYRREGRGAVTAADRERIAKLAIPPAWRDVWICADPRGHLQASGRDARGRKQYRYHRAWRVSRDRGKFDRMTHLLRALPRLRRQVRRDLARPGLPLERVLAAAVCLLARTLMRVGNREYAHRNDSYGLTTLLDRHLRVRGSGIRLRFNGKSGKPQRFELDDARLARLLRRCQALPGQHLFEYLQADGEIGRIASTHVNDYLRTAADGDFTAKDLRSLGATLAAVALCAQSPPPPSAQACASREREIVAQVAGMLGNTPAVCRASYLHPIVLSAWRDGRIAALQQRSGARSIRRWERIARALLEVA